MTESEEVKSDRFLVYASGFPENGLEISEEEIQEGLSSGRLNTCDLIWVNGAWRQLSDVFELEPYQLPDCSDPSEEDLALLFKRLPSCSLKLSVQNLPGSHGQGFCAKSFLLRHIVHKRSGARRPWWQILLLLAILLAFLVGAVLFAVIPNVNRLLWRPANIFVTNPYPTACTLHFQKEEYKLPPNGSVTISDIFGRMPRTEKLIFKHPKEQEAKVIQVPLRGAETVLVNPMGMMFFGVVRTDVQSSAINGANIQQIQREILADKAPATALEVADKAKSYGEKVLVAQSDAPLIYSSDPIISDDHLNLEQLGYQRSSKDVERRGLSPKPPANLRSRNLLRGVNLNNVTIRYRKGSKDVAECSFRLNFPHDRRHPFIPATRFTKQRPLEFRSFEPVSGAATCTVSYGANNAKVIIRFDRRNSKIQRHQRELLGRWAYEATYDLQRKSWSWQWNYEGNDRIRVAFLNLTIKNGKFISKYNEKRNRR